MRGGRITLHQRTMPTTRKPTPKKKKTTKVKRKKPRQRQVIDWPMPPLDLGPSALPLLKQTKPRYLSSSTTDMTLMEYLSSTTLVHRHHLWPRGPQ